MQINIRVDVFHHAAPDASPPSPDTRLILTAVSALGTTMALQSAKLAAALATLTADDTDLSNEIALVIADDQSNRQNVAAAVASALAQAGVDEDTAATAVASVNTVMEANSANLKALLQPPAAPVALAVSSTSLPDSTIGVAYTSAVSIVGGVAPYDVTASGVPAGITVDASGNVSGTPTGPSETASISISVADSATPSPNVATGTASLNVLDTPPPTN